MKLLLSLWMVLLIPMRCGVAAPLVPAQPMVFRLGEKLTYRISWSNFIEAGTAELTVGQGDSLVANSYRFQLKATSTVAISNIYFFKDEFVSLFDAAYGAPTRFEKNFVEKKRSVKEIVTFDQMNRTATVVDSKRQTQRVIIEVGTQDPLSALYCIRGLGLRPGLQVILPVHDGGKNFQLEIKVVGSDLISTTLGSFETHRVEVGLKRDGSLLTDKKITVWFTNDANKVPVLASVALSFGAALIELVSQ